jgi:quercetin dioxygenase-like cupin family protein
MRALTIKRSVSWAISWLFICLPPALAADGTEGLPHAFEAGWKGQQTCTLLYETEEVRVGSCSFPPGIGHEKHYHNPHFGIVIEGGTMWMKDQSGESEATFETGMTWASDELRIHEAVNIGDTTARYLIVEPRVDPVEP